MTKYYEFQRDLLRSALKGAVDPKRRRFYKIDNDTIYCIPDGNYLIGVPVSLWMLDNAKIFENWLECDTSRLINEDIQLSALDAKNVITTGSKLKLHRFVVNGQDVYVNEKILKYFDLENSTFKGTDNTSPIYIYELGSLVGLVLPVHYVKRSKENERTE